MTDDPRTAQRRRFVIAAGLDPDRCMALPADASARRYFRMEGSTPAQLLMDVTPGESEFPRFIMIAQHLCALGLSAPGVLHADLAGGLALIEDFGRLTYTQALVSGHDERQLYQLAVDALVSLHQAPCPVDVPAYDMTTLTHESELFAHWYAPGIKPGLDVSAFTTHYNALWREALVDIALQREVLVLRDYHVDNLMIIAGRSGVAACGLLDFQDALIGSCAYDLASLCQDARRDLSDGLEDELIARYAAARPEIDLARFHREYWLLAAHRHAKVAGIFERLAQLDRKPIYLNHQPRVLRLLARALEQAGLHEIRALLDHELPTWQQYRLQPQVMAT